MDKVLIEIAVGYSENVETGETEPVVILRIPRPEIPMTVYQAKQFRDYLDKQIARGENLPSFEEVRDRPGGPTIERAELLPSPKESN